MKRNKTKMFVEAVPLLGKNPSGVGKLLYSMIDALLKDRNFTDNYELVLVMPLGKKHELEQWDFDGKYLKTATIPLLQRMINLLDRFHLMIPIDLICGKGVYLFANYRRLPLLWSPSLTYIHDASYILHPETVHPLNLPFLKRVVPRSVAKSDTVITLSQQSQKELIDAFPAYKDKIVVVPAAADAEKYRCHDDAKTIQAILDRVGVRPKKYLLHVGNIEPRKNLDYVIDVYIELRKDPANTNLELLLIGSDGWKSDAVLRRIDDLNQKGFAIVRPSYRVADSELPALYKESFASVLFSVHEGFGMTPLEALAAGARVIVSDIPVLHDVGGQAVAYVPLDNAPKAAKIVQTEASKQPNPTAIKKQLDMFTWAKAATQLIHLIDNTMEQKKRK